MGGVARDARALLNLALVPSRERAWVPASAPEALRRGLAVALAEAVACKGVRVPDDELLDTQT